MRCLLRFGVKSDEMCGLEVKSGETSDLWVKSNEMSSLVWGYIRCEGFIIRSWLKSFGLVPFYNERDCCHFVLLRLHHD